MKTVSTNEKRPSDGHRKGAGTTYFPEGKSMMDASSNSVALQDAWVAEALFQHDDGSGIPLLSRMWVADGRTEQAAFDAGATALASMPEAVGLHIHRRVVMH